MPELRRDPVCGQWIIIAPNRSARPTDHPAASHRPDPADGCPFCRGHESQTPPATLTIDRDGNTVPGESDWLVRVIPNRYPALTSPSPGEVSGQWPQLASGSASMPFERQPAHGHHEVIVESPAHHRLLTQLDVPQVERILSAWRARMEQLAADPHVRHISLFRNSGAAAGASLEHVHSQIMALPFVPPRTLVELQAAEQHLQQEGCRLWSQLITDERTDGSRVLDSTDGFTVYCPFASQFPAEIWIVPRIPAPHFAAASMDTLQQLAAVLHRTLRQLDTAFGQPDFNLSVHTAPLHDRRREAYQWHVRILPRLSGIAGFELSSGSWINPLAPEDAARQLRDAAV